MEQISFAPDILEELSIAPIKKPGTDKDAYFAWRRERSAQFTAEERMHGAAKKKLREKSRAVAELMAAKRDTSFTKGQLQAVNHGHIKLK